MAAKARRRERLTGVPATITSDGFRLCFRTYLDAGHHRDAGDHRACFLAVAGCWVAPTAACTRPTRRLRAAGNAGTAGRGGQSGPRAGVARAAPPRAEPGRATGTGGTGGTGARRTSGVRQLQRCRDRRLARPAAPAARCSTSRPTFRARRSTPVHPPFRASRKSSAFTYCGSGALAITAMFSGTSGATTKGEVLINLPGAPVDLTGKTITVHVASDPGCSTDLNLSLVLNTQAGPVYFTPAFPIRPVTNMWKTGTATVTAVAGSTSALALSLQAFSSTRLPGNDLRRRDRHPLNRIGRRAAGRRARPARARAAARPGTSSRTRPPARPGRRGGAPRRARRPGRRRRRRRRRERLAIAASASGASARGLSERVATTAAATGASAASIASASLSSTTDTSSTTRRPGASAGRRRGQRARAVGVVGAVEQQVVATRSQRPGQLTPASPRASVRSSIGLPELAAGRARQLRPRARRCSFWCAPDKRDRERRRAEVARRSGTAARRRRPPRASISSSASGGSRPDEARHARLEDAGLLARDRAPACRRGSSVWSRPIEVIAVAQRHAGRDRVEAPAEAGLQHRDLDAGLGHGQEREHRRDLEVGQRHARSRRPAGRAPPADRRRPRARRSGCAR